MLAVENHTFVYYKKLPEEMEIYKPYLQENNIEISWFDSPMWIIKYLIDSQNVYPVDSQISW